MDIIGNNVHKELVFHQHLIRNATCSYYAPTLFEFTGVNTTDNDITVTEWKSSCGCTKAHYPKPIKPGEFTVTVSIDKSGHSGSFNQSVTLTFSNQQIVVLRVNGQIEKPTEYGE